MIETRFFVNFFVVDMKSPFLVQSAAMNMKMKKLFKIIGAVFLTIASFYLLKQTFSQIDIAVLNPKGLIAIKERELIIAATQVMLIIVIPVFIMTGLFVWKYRAHKKSTYAPDWDYSLLAESLWWGFPFVIVFFLSILAWNSTHDLDPSKPIETAKKPLTIQVVALQWKWLFIYPEYNIASVNFLQFPEHTPLNFEITSDAPMNSFWIPQLGSQMYAMAGMKSKLHLIAHEVGDFRGVSANLSGEGFSKMNFIAKATSEEEFIKWIAAAQKSPQHLERTEYKKLAQPGVEYSKEAYLLKEKNLFDWILMKYMLPMPKEKEE